MDRATWAPVVVTFTLDFGGSVGVRTNATLLHIPRAKTTDPHSHVLNTVVALNDKIC